MVWDSNMGSVQRILGDVIPRKWFIRVYQVVLADPGIFLFKAKVLPYDSQAQYVSDLWVIDRLKRRIFIISLLCEPLNNAFIM